MAAVDVTSAHRPNASRPMLWAPTPGERGRFSSFRKNARAITRRIAARPALNRKNFTPASRETKTSVKMIPSARWLRKRKRTTLSGCESLVDLRPVDDVPPRGDVIGPAVLVLQIVRMFPHVDPKYDLLAFHQRAVLVGAAFDRGLPTLIEHPRPPAAQAADRGLGDLLFERIEAAE